MSKYTDWVKTLPCCVTGFEGETDPHHIKGYAHLTGSGVGKKGSDLLCIPLKHSVHTDLHNSGWRTWELENNVSQLEEAVKTILKAEKRGIICLSAQLKTR